MSDRWFREIGKLGLIASLAVVGSRNAIAQIVPDNTLGNENSVVVPINTQLEHIQGGALRGSNLFHSFQEFNVQNGQSAYFLNPAIVENIFSRVTGGNVSEILGTLGVLGEANLYLINPNGIIFGENASLDIKGSFVASTASSLLFEDGREYSALNPEIPGAIINHVPIQISLQFEGEPAAIVNAGHLQTGGNITLAGGMVVNTGHISAPDNTVNLLAVQPETTVQMSDRADIVEAIEPIVASELESDLEVLEELSEETGLRVTETGDYEILGTGITISPETGLTVASGEIEATGGTVRVLGNKVGLVDVNINVSGEDGGGTVLIGGNYRGENSLLNAERTWVNEGTNIAANAIGKGDGGSAIVWADGATVFSGNMSARGGEIAGDGGFVEVSGKENLLFDGIVDVGASHGNAGILLLDPSSLTIIDALSGDGDLDNSFPLTASTPDIDTNTISWGQIDSLLSSGDVILQANGDITIADITGINSSIPNEIKLSSNSLYTLTLQSDGGGIIFADSDDIIKTGGANLDIVADRNINIGSFLTKGSLFADSGMISIISRFGNINADAFESNSSFLGNANNVTVTAKNGSITIDELDSSSLVGIAGIINVEAEGDITILDRIKTSNGIGDGGNITIVSMEGTIDTSMASRPINSGSINGNGGKIILEGNTGIITGEMLSGSQNGDGGDIKLTSDRGTIRATDGNINAGSLSGNGGNITLNANGDVTIAEFINTIGTVEGGDVTIISQNGSIQGEVFAIGTGEFNDTILATEFGITLPPLPPRNLTDSNAGAIALSARGDIQLTRGILSASGETNVGGIRGAGGKVSFHSGNSIVLTDFLASNSSEFGHGNDMELTGKSISFTQASLNNGSYNTTQQSGNIIITAPESIELSQNSTIQVQVANPSLGGNIIINQTNRLSLQDSVILANANSNRPGGQAGNVIVNANSVEISGTSSGTFFGASLEGIIPSSLASLSSRQGNSGGVIVNSDRLTLSNGGSINATSADQGQGGNITINSDSILIDGTSDHQLFSSGISADALTSGNSGNITINTDELKIQNGGNISASTFGTGQGGTVNINAPEISLNGTSEDGQIKTGIYAQSFDAGNAGSINITTDRLTLQNEAKITVSSDPQAEDSGNLIQKSNAWIDLVRSLPDNNIDPNFRVARGMGNGDAGNINISANDNIVMQNQAQIVAETSSGDGGNINLEIGNLLLMRHDSKISTTAGTAQAGGNGGNITIDVKDGFIVGPRHEDNDITANAFEGNGGNINITAQAIFGLKIRDELTPLSDITASSEFGLDGTVQINTLGIDPSNGLTNLPEEQTDPEVRQGCSQGGENSSSFTIQGIGGSPDNPDDMLTAEIDAEFIPLDELETDGAIAEKAEEIEAIAPEKNNTPLLFACQ